MKRTILNFLRHPLFSGSAIMIGGNMTVNVINYVYHIIMGRMLGPVNYSVLASLYSILYIISIIPLSSSFSIVKFISSAKDDKEIATIYKSLNKFIFYLGIILALMVLIVSPVTANFLQISNFILVALIAPILFLSLATLVNQSTSQGLLKFIGVSGPNLISSVVKFIVGIILVIVGWSVFGAMIGVTLGALFAYLYSLWYVKKFLPTNCGNHFNFKPFLKYALPVLIQALAFTSLFTADVILVKHFFSPFEAGLYAALSMLGKVIYFAASPVVATMFPIVASRYAKKEPYLKVFWVALGLTLIASLTIVIFYYLFPGIAIGVLYGKNYLAAKGELIWMGVFMLLYTTSYLVVNFLLSLNRVKIVAIPLAASFLQVIFIWSRHGSLLQVIQNSLIITLVMFLALMVYLGYNRLARIYAKTKD